MLCQTVFNNDTGFSKFSPLSSAVKGSQETPLIKVVQTEYPAVRYSRYNQQLTTKISILTEQYIQFFFIFPTMFSTFVLCRRPDFFCRRSLEVNAAFGILLFSFFLDVASVCLYSNFFY